MMNPVSKNKFVLPIIILLLLITLPLGIIGMISHNKDVYIASNPNKEHKYNGQLFYYDEAGNLLGTYKCKVDDCTDVSTKINDEYLSITPGEEDTIAYSGDRKAFVFEGGEIKLVSFISEAFERHLFEVKNYGNNSLPFIVVKNDDGYYTALSSATHASVIPQDYDYVGFIYNQSANGYFSVSKNNRFYIIQSEGPAEEKVLSASFNSPIFYYNSSLIVTSSSGSLQLFDFDGTLLENNITKLGHYGDAIVIKNSYNNVYVYYNKDDIKKYDEIGSKYDFQETLEGIEIYRDGLLEDTVTE